MILKVNVGGLSSLLGSVNHIYLLKDCVVDSEVIILSPGVEHHVFLGQSALVGEPGVGDGDLSLGHIRLCLACLESNQLFVVLGDKGGIELPAPELRVKKDSLQEFNVSGQADDLVLVEGGVKGLDGLIPVWGVHDQLRDHWVVKCGDGVSLSHSGVDS